MSSTTMADTERMGNLDMFTIPMIRCKQEAYTIMDGLRHFLKLTHELNIRDSKSVEEKARKYKLLYPKDLEHLFHKVETTAKNMDPHFVRSGVMPEKVEIFAPDTMKRINKTRRKLKDLIEYHRDINTDMKRRRTKVLESRNKVNLCKDKLEDATIIQTSVTQGSRDAKRIAKVISGLKRDLQGKKAKLEKRVAKYYVTLFRERSLLADLSSMNTELYTEIEQTFMAKIEEGYEIMRRAIDPQRFVWESQSSTAAEDLMEAISDVYYTSMD